MSRLIAVILCLSTASTLFAQADAKKVAAVELTVAHIEIKGSYNEGTEPPGLFSEVVETMNDALQRLKKAAGDDRLDAVVLHINSPKIGWAKLNELRTGISKIRAMGRKVYAWMESGEN